jgi:hypothetical protein
MGGDLGPAEVVEAVKLVLGESVTLAMALGAAVIVAGTTLVLGLWPRSQATSAA